MAQVRVNFSDAALNHVWEERPGTWHWQEASVYLPATTVTKLGPNDYLTLAGMWPSSGGNFGWWLRVRQGGVLNIVGYDADGNPHEFQIYGTFPQDQWVSFEMGLHSQAGPGIKRTFGLLINGNFYGWFHQGHMVDEEYDQAAIGILSTTANAPLEIFIDDWRAAGIGRFPGGPDNRVTANLQESDYRAQCGVDWQIDWSTWQNDLRMQPEHGLFSNTNRLQSGLNIDRMPTLTSGWAEIELDWSQGKPPANPQLGQGAFAGLLGMRKEINREENLEVAPIIRNDQAMILYDAWVGGAPTEFATWALPAATTADDGRNIPEPGDILRVRWEQLTAANINVRASYYDASTQTWYSDVINTTTNVSAVPSSNTANVSVNFNDGYHTASSITIDTPYYAIRRYQVGTLDTFPSP